THEHVHALEQHSLFDAFHIQDALVTVKVGTKNLYHTTQEFFQALGIEGLAGGKYKGTDFIIVMRMVMIVLMAVMMVMVAVFIALMIVMMVMVAVFIALMVMIMVVFL